MSRSHLSLILVAALFTLLSACAGPRGDAREEAAARKVPVTSSSAEARELYRQGLDLFDKLRTAEAREHFERAVELDPSFAMAHLGLANSAQTYQEYYESLDSAVAAAASASQGEQWLIKASQAGISGDSRKELSLYQRLLASYPEDERVHDLLGSWYFNEQDFAKAAEHSRRATEIAPSFSSPYNNLGYALEALGDYEGAEQAFVKYIELIPEDPNPYDSYGELLMKTGRYEESIESYRKALAKDPTFYSSELGIGYDQLYLGRIEEAAATFEAMLASFDGYRARRQALLGSVSCALVAGDADAALALLEQHRDIASETGDPLELASDLRLIARFHIEHGEIDEASKLLDEASALTESGDVPPEVKSRLRRRQIYWQALLALANADLDLAKQRTDEFTKKISLLEGPSELRLAFALDGEIALAREDYEGALKSLAQADQTDPRVLWLEASAAHRKGDLAAARELAQRVVRYNEPIYGFALYRARAEELLR